MAKKQPTGPVLDDDVRAYVIHVPGSKETTGDVPHFPEPQDVDDAIALARQAHGFSKYNFTTGMETAKLVYDFAHKLVAKGQGVEGRRLSDLALTMVESNRAGARISHINEAALDFLEAANGTSVTRVGGSWGRALLFAGILFGADGCIEKATDQTVAEHTVDALRAGGAWAYDQVTKE